MDTPINKAHIFGIGLDATDGHKRITRAEQFSIVGGSEETHDRLTETLVKTFEDINRRGKTLESVERKELTDLINKNTPQS